MATITVTVKDNKLKAESDYIPSGNVQTVECEFSFDDSWDGISKTVVFYQDKDNHTDMVLGTTSTSCVVPWEVLLEAKPLSIGIYGTVGDQTKSTNMDSVPLADGTYREGTVPPFPTAILYAQLLDYVEEFRDSADNRITVIETNEVTRVGAEAIRVSNENTRKSAEAIRVSNEINRKSAETIRENFEGARRSAEATRASNENARKSAESGRNTAEEARASAEEARADAEEARAAFYNKYNDSLTTISNIIGTGIIEGFEVTATTPETMTVNVSAGTAVLPSGEKVEIDATTVDTSALQIKYIDRHNLIYINASGVISYIAGTAMSVPDTPEGGLAVSEVYVRDEDEATAIYQADITDIRDIIDENTLLVKTTQNTADIAQNTADIEGLENELDSKSDTSHTHSNYAPKASPTFTGIPKAPTAVAGTNTTQVATTAFVKNAVDSASGEIGANIEGLENDVTELDGKVSTNTDNITANTTNIATNTDNITANTTNIATNTANIATKADDTRNLRYWCRPAHFAIKCGAGRFNMSWDNPDGRRWVFPSGTVDYTDGTTPVYSSTAEQPDVVIPSGGGTVYLYSSNWAGGYSLLANDTRGVFIGDVADMPPITYHLRFDGTGAMGNTINLPPLSYILWMNNCSQITGDIKHVPPVSRSLGLTDTSVYGDLQNLHNLYYELFLSRTDVHGAYVNVWGDNVPATTYLNNTQMTAIDIDNTLIAYSSCTKTGGTFQANGMTRTSASDNAIEHLTTPVNEGGLGWTVSGITKV